MSSVPMSFSSHPVKLFELIDDFKGKPDEFYIAVAQNPGKQGLFAEAGVFVSEIKNEGKKKAITSLMIQMIENLNKTNPSKA